MSVTTLSQKAVQILSDGRNIIDLDDTGDYEHWQAKADEAAILARDLQDKADDAYQDQLRRSKSSRASFCNITTAGRDLLSILSHDDTRLISQSIIMFIGQNELDDTLNDLLACRKGKFDRIRPITIQRGFISCMDTNNNGGAQ